MMPEKNSGLNAMRTHDLCNTGANWELVTLFVMYPQMGKNARGYVKDVKLKILPIYSLALET